MDEETRKKLEEWNREVGTGGSFSSENNEEKSLGEKEVKLSNQESQTTTRGSKSKKEGVGQQRKTSGYNNGLKKNPLGGFSGGMKEQKLDETKAKTPTSSTKGPTSSIRNEEKSSEQAAKKTPIKKELEKRQERHESSLKAIRTYETDAAEHIQRRKSSLSSITIAEQQRKRSGGNKVSRQKSSGNKSVLYVTLSLILVGAGLGMLYGWYALVYTNQNDAEYNLSDSIVSAEEIDTANIENYDNRNTFMVALNNFRESPEAGLGEVHEIQFFKTETQTSEGERVEEEIPVTARDFFEKLAVNAPLTIYRSLEPEITYGTAVLEHNYPFIILRTSFFQNAFVSMLNWEETLAQDLSFITAEVPAEELAQKTLEVKVAPATSTDELGTSTPMQDVDQATTTHPEDTRPTRDEILRTIEFSDKVVSNQDTRVGTYNGKTYILYSFPNEETLIITTNEKSFDMILERLNRAYFSQ